MVKSGRKPELIVIAGPNGSGKTSMTQKFLHHEWADGTVYINPDQIVNDRDAQIQFRLSNGKLEKMYVKELPTWAKNIIPDQ